MTVEKGKTYTVVGSDKGYTYVALEDPDLMGWVPLRRSDGMNKILLERGLREVSEPIPEMWINVYWREDRRSTYSGVAVQKRLAPGVSDRLYGTIHIAGDGALSWV